MENPLDNEIFDLEQYINRFKKKKKFQINNLSEINKILNSMEYSRFINSLYNFFNKLVPKVDGRLALKYYSDADGLIEQFWNRVLGNDLYDEFVSELRAKLHF